MRDVRMKGFAERADVEEVDRFLRERTRPLDAEEVSLDACVGRVLAEDVRAEVDVPGFARAAMDGYAVRGEDTFGASDWDPIHLALRGEALPGAPFDGTLSAGEALNDDFGVFVNKNRHGVTSQFFANATAARAASSMVGSERSFDSGIPASARI